AIRRRHADYYVRLAEAAGPELTRADQRRWLARVEAEHDNLRAVLEMAQTEGSAAEVGLQLVGAIWRFWWVRGHLSEGRRWLEGFIGIAVAGGAAIRARALMGAGVLAYHQGDYERAGQRHEESLGLQRELGDRLGIASSLNTLGLVAYQQG